jgi:hypothetical protein
MQAGQDQGDVLVPTTRTACGQVSGDRQPDGVEGSGDGEGRHEPGAIQYALGIVRQCAGEQGGAGHAGGDEAGGDGGGRPVFEDGQGRRIQGAN